MERYVGGRDSLEVESIAYPSRKILRVKTYYFARPFDFTAGQYITVFIDSSVSIA